MKVLNKVLWAVDFNQNHSVSTKKLEKVYKQFGNELIILNVLPEELEGTSFTEVVERSIASELESLKKEMSFDKDKKVTTLIKYGSIVDTILDVAESQNVNAIFLNQGNRDKGKYNKLGANAFNTILNSHKPVFIIANDVKDDNNGILCAVDFSASSAKALNNAILHAKKSGQKLTVMSVFTPVNITSPRLLKLGVDVVDENNSLLMKFEKEFNNFLKSFNFLDIEYEQKILNGNVVNEIVREAKRANILYIGSTGKTGLKRVFLGSITEKVIQEVPCNIVITKSEDIFKLKAPANIKDVNNHFEIASQLKDLGYYDKAIEHYKECLNLNTMHLPSVIELSKLYDQMGKKETVFYYDNMYANIMEQFNNWKIEQEVRRTMRI